MDRSFNCAHYLQSLQNTSHRVKPKNEQIHYYFFISKGTIDEIVNNRLEEKRNIMLRLLDDDFAILDLETSDKESTDEKEEEADFNALVLQLKKLYS